MRNVTEHIVVVQGQLKVNQGRWFWYHRKCVYQFLFVINNNLSATHHRRQSSIFGISWKDRITKSSGPEMDNRTLHGWHTQRKKFAGLGMWYEWTTSTYLNRHCTGRFPGSREVQVVYNSAVCIKFYGVLGTYSVSVIDFQHINGVLQCKKFLHDSHRWKWWGQDGDGICGNWVGMGTTRMGMGWGQFHGNGVGMWLYVQCSSLCQSLVGTR